MRVKSTCVDSLVEDAVYKILSLEEVLDDIYELRERGQLISMFDLHRLTSHIENCAMHEALADDEMFRK